MEFDPAQVPGIITQGGIAALLVFVLGRVIWKIGINIVEALKQLQAEIAAHTKADLAHHGDVKEAIAALEGRIDGIMEVTPVEVPRERSMPYRYTRKKTDPTGEK